MENNTKKWVTVLGATGSIGSSTLDVIARHPDRLGVFAISAATQAKPPSQTRLRIACVPVT